MICIAICLDFELMSFFWFRFISIIMYHTQCIYFIVWNYQQYPSFSTLKAMKHSSEKKGIEFCWLLFGRQMNNISCNLNTLFLLTYLLKLNLSHVRYLTNDHWLLLLLLTKESKRFNRCLMPKPHQALDKHPLGPKNNELVSQHRPRKEYRPHEFFLDFRKSTLHLHYFAS